MEDQQSKPYDDSVHSAVVQARRGLGGAVGRKLSINIRHASRFGPDCDRFCRDFNTFRYIHCLETANLLVFKRDRLGCHNWVPGKTPDGNVLKEVYTYEK